MIVRKAQESEFPQLVEMGRRFWAESPYHELLPENPERMSGLLSQLLNGAGGVLVADEDGTLIGMIGYIVFDHPMSGERVAGEAFWWVQPERRGSRAAGALLSKAEEAARAAGARKMQMVAPTERVGKLYERLGFQYVESTYQRSLT